MPITFFGVYGSAMLGDDGSNPASHHLLETLILLTFLGINLYGVKASGTSELLIVTVKVTILFLFAVIGMFAIKPDYVLPKDRKSKPLSPVESDKTSRHRKHHLVPALHHHPFSIPSPRRANRPNARKYRVIPENRT